MSDNTKAGIILLAVIFLLGTVPYLGVIIAGIMIAVYLVYWWKNTPYYLSKQKIGTVDAEFYEENKKLSQFLLAKNDYMNSAEWKTKRSKVLFYANYMCELCLSTENLEVHHLSGYNKIPNESLSDLACLCRSCHQKQHDYYGYPKTYKDYMEWSTTLY